MLGRRMRLKLLRQIVFLATEDGGDYQRCASPTISMKERCIEHASLASSSHNQQEIEHDFRREVKKSGLVKGRPFLLSCLSCSCQARRPESIMMVTQALFFMAQLATVVVAEYYPVNIQDYSVVNETEYGRPGVLDGAEALSYLFDYDPSRSHGEEQPLTIYKWLDGTRENREKMGEYWVNYDTGYLQRICSPRVATGEWQSAYMNSSLFTETPERNYYNNGSRDEAYEAEIRSYKFNLNAFRGMMSGTPYPCERLNWIVLECGENISIYGGRTPGPDSIAEQNTCICNSDYFEAQKACQACHDFHIGNEEHAAEIAHKDDVFSSSMCAEAATATKSRQEYWSSAHGSSEFAAPPNSTIVKDGAPRKTDVSLYYTGNVDFVPATIQEPAFTRTMGDQKVVMTPGTVIARATGMATGAQAGQPAVTAPPEKAGAPSLRVGAGWVVAMMGALML